MSEPSVWQSMFEELVALIQKEADGFAAVLDKMVSFDVVSECGTAIDIFTAAGTALMTLFLCMEVFTYCAAIDFNGGIEGALRVAMKMVVSAMIVQNTSKIVGAVSGLFKSVSLTSYSEAFSGIASSFSAASTAGDVEGGVLDINYICMSFLLILLVAVLFIMVSMLGVVFETGILVAISPVALATLVNLQARSAGIAFIKNFAAVSMQWGVLSICFMAYNKVSTGMVLDFAAGMSNKGLLIHIMQYSTPLLSVIILAVTVSKASEITKRALGG